MKLGMVIDLEKCIGCRSCMIACKIHNGQPAGNWWNSVFTPGSFTHLVPPEKVFNIFFHYLVSTVKMPLVKRYAQRVQLTRTKMV